MRVLVLIACIFLIAGCDDSGENNGGVAAADTARKAGPVVQHFGFTDEVLAVVEGAGCTFSAPGINGDSALFALSTDAVIYVNGKLQILKAVGEYLQTDSTSEMHFENSAYHVGIVTVIDSAMESGATMHGKMKVEDKNTGSNTTLAIAGSCGC